MNVENLTSDNLEQYNQIIKYRSAFTKYFVEELQSLFQVRQSVNCRVEA